VTWTALFLSRIQFAFAVVFHIILSFFAIGLAAWLAVLEGLNLATRLAFYRWLFGSRWIRTMSERRARK
jgi:cytochrome d ubiquinol oxidase subunit I